MALFDKVSDPFDYDGSKWQFSMYSKYQIFTRMPASRRIEELTKRLDSEEN